MQYPFSLIEPHFSAVEKTMSPARLARYFPEAGGDKQLALRLYVWNAQLCQEFYIPLQITEVAVRNGVHRRLQQVYLADWANDSRFISNLNQRSKDELANVQSDERAKRGAALTIDHIVGGLSFGFWLSILGRSFEHILWRYTLTTAFPKIPRRETRPDLVKKLDQFRRFRNAVMHHFAIFDKAPTTEWNNIQTILGWACPSTIALVKELSNPLVVLQNKPKF
jgi:hypothetical protein